MLGDRKRTLRIFNFFTKDGDHLLSIDVSRHVTFNSLVRRLEKMDAFQEPPDLERAYHDWVKGGGR